MVPPPAPTAAATQGSYSATSGDGKMEPEEKENIAGAVPLGMEERLVCRLIALHNRKFVAGPVKGLYIGKHSPCVKAECIAESEEAENVKCRFFLVPTQQDDQSRKDNEGCVDGEQLLRQTSDAAAPGKDKDLHVCFNWYSPQSGWSYATSVYSMLLQHTGEDVEIPVKEYFAVRGRKLLHNPNTIKVLREYAGVAAERFLGGGGGAVQEGEAGRKQRRKEEEEAEKMMEEEKTGNEENGSVEGCRKNSASNGGSKCHHTGSSSSSSRVSRIVLSGFSQGAAFAHVFAFLLKEQLQVTDIPIRVIGFGPPRFSRSGFADWCDNNLNNTRSLNIVAAEKAVAASGGDGGLSLDPVCCCNTEDELQWQPNLHILLEGSSLQPCTSLDKQQLQQVGEVCKVSKTTILMNCVYRLSPHSAEYDRLYSKFHNIVSYYEKMV
eukprot:GHVS01005599.1.p1 GENE.GHVS01005599.1~~GHVS01005599.1.p1  ORF type:complete len:436 (-),score=106.43 GHVS01005599.1:2140-3447(-)